MLRDRIMSLRNANEYNLHYDRHIVSSVRVKPDSDEHLGSRARATWCSRPTWRDNRACSASGRYQDKVRREGDKFLFAEKVVIVDTFSIPTLLATPL